MAKTGFRFDVSGLKQRLAKLSAIVAEDFTPQLLEFTRRSLTTASRKTPARSLSKIEKAQRKQYLARVNCIPDSHSLPDPSLRIRGSKHWLFFNDRWWNATDWRLTADAWAAYRFLLAEHERRMQYAQAKFIEDRAQARFLYKKSWVEVGQSVGVRVDADADVTGAVTRRKPAKNPPRGYAQMRGGKTVKSIVVRNPFLNMPSRYITFSASEIITSAMSENNAEYRRSLKTRLRELTATI